MTGELTFLPIFPQEPMPLSVTFMLPGKSNNLEDISPVVPGWRGIFQDSRHCQEKLMEDRSRTSGLVQSPSLLGDITGGPNSAEEWLFFTLLVSLRIQPSWGWEKAVNGVTVHQTIGGIRVMKLLQASNYHQSVPLICTPECVEEAIKYIKTISTNNMWFRVSLEQLWVILRHNVTQRINALKWCLLWWVWGPGVVLMSWYLWFLFFSF